MRKITFNDDEINTIKDMYLNENKSPYDISLLLNKSEYAISKLVNDLGIKKTNEEIQKGILEKKIKKGICKKLPLSRDELYDLYIIQNKTTKEIYEMIGCFSDSEISRQLLKYGIKKDKDAVLSLKKKHNIEKYGVENVSQSDIVKEKIKQTCLEKYGFENAFQSEEVKSKMKQTCLERYGVENPNQSDVVRERTKQTCLEKYGVESVLLSDEINDKIKQTCLEKYGVENVFSSEEIKEKIKTTNIKKYGYTSASFSRMPERARFAFLSKENLVEELNRANKKTTKELSKILNVAWSTVISYINKFDLWSMIDNTCSSGESEVKEYVESLGVSAYRDRNILDGKEIDIYCPDYKIGIEFNGDYWHSSSNVEKNYHYKKSLLAQEKGVRLIHIYEYEWNDPVKQPIIKSMLKIAFGKVENRIYARNCEVREISNIEARDFNNANHLQGHKNAQITYGLYYKDNLVQLMSFSYYPKKGWWEIERGCPGSNNVVVGGVSKLFKHFLKEHNPDKVFSYCDFNKFDGKGYEAIGMELLGYTGPDMKWLLEDGTVANRQPSKHKILKDLAFAKIWGAGSKRYLWKKNSEEK